MILLEKSFESGYKKVIDSAEKMTIEHKMHFSDLLRAPETLYFAAAENHILCYNYLRCQYFVLTVDRMEMKSLYSQHDYPQGCEAAGKTFKRNNWKGANF